MTEAVFEQYVSAANKLGQEITAQGLLRLQRILANQQKSTKPCENGFRERNGRAIPVPAAERCARNDRPVSAPVNAQDSAAEIYAEMKNHRRLLERILRPFCAGENATLQRAEKRQVLRLLAEIEQTVGEP